MSKLAHAAALVFTAFVVIKAGDPCTQYNDEQACDSNSSCTVRHPSYPSCSPLHRGLGSNLAHRYPRDDTLLTAHGCFVSMRQAMVCGRGTSWPAARELRVWTVCVAASAGGTELERCAADSTLSTCDPRADPCSDTFPVVTWQATH